MARMQSGDDFPEFDQMTDTETKRRLKELSGGVGALQNSCLSITVFEEYKTQASQDHKELVVKHEFLTEEVYRDKRVLEITRMLLYPFLKSRLMHFLNFFGKWYIYGKDGNIYPDRDEFERYRPDPWYIRASIKWNNFVRTQRERYRIRKRVNQLVDQYADVGDEKEAAETFEPASDSSDSEDT